MQPDETRPLGLRSHPKHAIRVGIGDCLTAVYVHFEEEIDVVVGALVKDENVHVLTIDHWNGEKWEEI